MEVCIFKNLRTAIPQRTSLEKIVQMILTSPLLKEYTDKARKYYVEGNKEKVNSIKTNLLPAFAPAGYLIDGKGRYNLIGLTGLCFVDIDHVENEQVESAMAKLREDEHVLLAARSISGKGLHILVPYCLWREDTVSSLPPTPAKTNQIYGSVFKSTAARYRDLLGLPTDKMAINAERLCLISYDDQAYFNAGAVPIIYQYEHQRHGIVPKKYLEYKELEQKPE